MKSIFEQNGGTYRQEGDYLIPNLELPENEDKRELGNYGRQHLEYIKKHSYSFYYQMLTSGKLHSYIADINEQALEMEQNIIQRMAKAEGVDEKLKAENQLKWVGLMNNFRHSAREIINSTIIYVK
ncbi:MAG: TnpV protein [Ruminococcaceae bacterium]|nr:TnpV protein [Oscillospiraceae bacterium]